MIRPGQAEYLDLLKALKEMSADQEEGSREQYQLRLLERISSYALIKSPLE